ncbi:zf-HC2 domain-containing protein [Bacillus pinisoli]|uniref:zf-HC2 domain-containing protein n=1 Tax=Bacillus pinisoli TaxID=2901866 RepID=UPI001FF45D2F|nr:anti-sigma factor [Bacillus pinisoli]
MKCDSKYIDYMHDYLDEDLKKEHEMELRDHLMRCKECQQHFHELKKTLALVQSASHMQAPTNFTERVMASLPQEKKVVKVKRWFKVHPLLTAAAVFFILMLGSVVTTWNGEQDLVVSKHPDLRIEENTVIVPEGTIIDGDILVKNGDLKIEGEIRGNVTVINGNQYLASAGNVTGEIEEIDQMFEYIWHHIKKGFKGITNIFSAS